MDTHKYTPENVYVVMQMDTQMSSFILSLIYLFSISLSISQRSNAELGDSYRKTRRGVLGLKP